MTMQIDSLKMAPIDHSPDSCPSLGFPRLDVGGLKPH